MNSSVMEIINHNEGFSEDRKYGNILDFIGNTPLFPITRLNPNKKVNLPAKLEQANPGGSIKDRPALYMIEEAERSYTLTKDKIVLEATSGERRKRLQAYGTQLTLTPARRGTDWAIEYVDELARDNPNKYFLVDQFNNEANWMSQYKARPRRSGSRLMVRSQPLLPPWVPAVLSWDWQVAKGIHPPDSDRWRATSPRPSYSRPQRHEGILQTWNF